MTKLEFKKKRRSQNDPILDNHYNKGDLDFVPYDTVVEIDKSYSSKYCDNYKNAHDYYRIELLEQKIDGIYTLTEWYKIYFYKKIPKIEMAQIFNFLRDRIDDASYTEVEIFTVIAEYLKVKYKHLYDSLSNTSKRKLLEELQENYYILNRVKRYKLF